MHADFDLDARGYPQPNGHGGRRAGAGGKPAGYTKPVEAQELDRNKARHEGHKADLAELEYKIKSGQYVDRAAVRQASATTMATLVQTMRSLSDNLERRGISPEICQMVDVEVNAALEQVGKDLAVLGGSE